MRQERGTVRPWSQVGFLGSALVTACVLLVLAQSATAAVVRTEVQVRGCYVLSAPDGGVRLLLDVDISVLPGDRDIVSASLTAGGLQGLGRATAVTAAVGTGWDGRTVAWASPWETPGGDWVPSSAVRAPFVSATAAGAVRWNVTEVIRYLYEHQGSHGILIFPPSERGQGFPQVPGIREAFQGSIVTVAHVENDVD